MLADMPYLVNVSSVRVNEPGNWLPNTSRYFRNQTVNLENLVISGSYFGGGVAALGAILNLYILCIFLTKRYLITPFTIHVVNMTIIDLAAATITAPLTVYRNLDRSWLLNITNCTFYKYTNRIIMTMLVLQHIVICLDRWLAVLAPFWYRRRRTITFGVTSTFAMLLYLHVWYVPLLHFDVKSSRNPGEYCDTIKGTSWYGQLVMIVTAFIPSFLVYSSYPLLAFTAWHQRRGRSKSLKLQNTIHPSGFASVINPPVDNQEIPVTRRRSHFSRNTRLVLTLVLVQFFLWTPSIVMGFLTSGKDGKPYLTDIQSFANTLGSVLLVADPLIYLAFLEDLRKETVKSLYKPRMEDNY